MGTEKNRIISLGDVGSVTVELNGAIVCVDAQGNIRAQTTPKGSITAYTKKPVQVFDIIKRKHITPDKGLPVSLGSSKGFLEVGEFYENEGVFIGETGGYRCHEDEGSDLCNCYEKDSLGGIFNVFTTKKDLKIQATFNNLIKKVSKIKKLHGYAGIVFDSEDSLKEALKDGNYKGGWITPPLCITKGLLYKSINEGCLKDTFNTSGGYTYGGDYANVYCTCSENSFDPSAEFFGVDITSGYEYMMAKGNDELSIRPIRLVRQV